jgi:4-hydroxy-tetrahydrodipicolinate synthase
MYSDESVNTEELSRQVERQIDAGVHGLFCLGTNGEFYSLTREERLMITDVVVKQTAGRLPVVAGVGCITTRETIDLAKETAKEEPEIDEALITVLAEYS